jgi:ribosomal subunit interface protein
MSSHIAFNGFDDAEASLLEAYWAKKLPRVQKLLVNYRKDLQEIQLTVYRHQQYSHHPRYEVRAVIHLPTGALAAEADETDPRAAVDRVADLLAKEIKRHKERVRKDYVYNRKSRARAELEAVQRDAQSGRQQDFFRLLRQNPAPSGKLAWRLRI